MAVTEEHPYLNPVQRVLIVSNMYPTLEHPAGGIFVHEQVKALRRRGLDVRVVYGRPVHLSALHPATALRKFGAALREAWAGWDAHDGVPVACFHYPAGAFARAFTYPWFYAAALRRWLPRLAEDFPYDVVHAHTAFLDGRAGGAAARHRGVPLVLTEHTGPLRVVTQDRRMRIHTQAGVDAADRLVAVSRALRDDMLAQLRIGDPGRITVLPNGVDTSFFDPARSAQRGARVELARVAGIFAALASEWEAGAPAGPTAAARIRDALEELADHVREEQAAAGAWGDPQAIHALWVGHHVEVKRVDRLLDAFAIARRHEPRLLLTLVGSGPLELCLRQQARSLGIEAHVRFLPAASREEVRDRMAAADFLVLPSASETFGVVVIEALAMGIPVLATDCGGPGDILDDPALGMLVPNTMEDVALGLQRMARGIRGFDAGRIRSMAIARFDYARLAESLVALYEQAARERSASAVQAGAKREMPGDRAEMRS